MLVETHLKIERMEYRKLGAAGTLSLNMASDLSAGLQPTSANTDALINRIRELEREATERDELLVQRLEAVREESAKQVRDELQAGTLHEGRSAAAQMQRVLEQFNGERDRYLAQVEQEVVRLALSIAGRILRREAQMDPLLLSGAVRVALGQLAEGTKAKLRVPSSEWALWDEMLRLMPNLPLRPDLVADESMKAEECVLEAELGNIDLGVRAQLKEIERGFFDLLEFRSKSGDEQAGTSAAGDPPTRPTG